MTIEELLCHPKRWCKGCAAFNSKGKECDPCADEAVMWSLDGAIKRCYENHYYEKNSDDVYKRVSNHPKVMQFVSWWNDKSTYQEVMEIVKELQI